MSINQAYRWPWEMATDLIQTNITENTLKKQDETPSWYPSPNGVVKVNIDAVFNPENNEGASGVVGTCMRYSRSGNSS
jgi:hypothetical protein